MNKKVLVIFATVLLISFTLGCIETEDILNTTKGFINTTKGFVDDITTEREPTPLDICRETVYAQMREEEERMPVGIKHMEIVEIKRFNDSEEALSYIKSYPLLEIESAYYSMDPESWHSGFEGVVKNEEFFYVAIGRFDLEQPVPGISRFFGAYVCDANGTLIYHIEPT